MPRYSRGWVKLHRKIEDNWISEDAYSLAIFDTLIRWAAYKKGKVVRSGTLLDTEPGQIVTSIGEISTKLRVSRNAVKRRLDMLEKDGVIGTLRGSRGTLITINNWDTYQSDEEEEKHEAVHRRDTGDTPEGQLAIRPRATYKEIKKERRERAAIRPSAAGQEMVDLWNAKCGHISSVQKLTKSRLTKIEARLKEEPVREYWGKVFDQISASSFCAGSSDRGWKASFDWIISNDTNHVKVSEGKYDDRSSEPVAPTKCPLCQNMYLVEVDGKDYLCRTCDRHKADDYKCYSHLPTLQGS